MEQWCHEGVKQHSVIQGMGLVIYELILYYSVKIQLVEKHYWVDIHAAIQCSDTSTERGLFKFILHHFRVSVCPSIRLILPAVLMIKVDKYIPRWSIHFKAICKSLPCFFVFKWCPTLLRHWERSCGKMLLWGLLECSCQSLRAAYWGIGALFRVPPHSGCWSLPHLFPPTDEVLLFELLCFTCNTY